MTGEQRLLRPDVEVKERTWKKSSLSSLACWVTTGAWVDDRVARAEDRFVREGGPAILDFSGFNVEATIQTNSFNVR